MANNINRWLKVDNDDAWITLVITMVGVVSAGFAAGFFTFVCGFWPSSALVAGTDSVTNAILTKCLT